ncbi:MAG: 16S rRNA (cytosine(1402)-N(4))-methyltransferase RsmH [Candidatus Marinimicrobia bacterium]|nr:16S rRNA (cytosine(1402)-N(4))-methyltransferase RsmH [Candidatus Neomarinimicrobiota bacterium]
MSAPYPHTPVLLNESVDLLVTSPAGVYVDATCGMGGHAEKICERINPEGRLLCFDMDPAAIAIARTRLARFQNVTFMEKNYDKLKVGLFAESLNRIDGILYDLGVSSLEIDRPERGFSFMQDGPLDMRMGRGETTAADIVNGYSREALTRIFREYGEERFSGRIAAAIVESRPFFRTRELADCIRGMIRGPYVNKTLARIFQALRIEVNGELESLKKSLATAMGLLNPGGRMVVISYHSLEDRIVKNTFLEAVSDCICPPQNPICTCGHKAQAKRITRKPLCPGETELRENPRSRSAKCRAIEKI